MRIKRCDLTQAGFLFVLLCVSIMPVLAAGHTLNPGDSIQQNITAAADGDTIILNPGTYAEYGILIDRDITIRANTSYGGSAGNTVIDAAGAGRIFDNSAGHSLVIDNLTMKNGFAYTGGGILMTGGTLAITSSAFSNCSANTGGALFVQENSNVRVDSSAFTGCSASFNGGAVYSSVSTTVSISSSAFSRCSASLAGGAVFSDGGSLSVDRSAFSGCTATNGGGVYTISGGSTVIEKGTVFTECTAAGSGGGIFAGSTDLNVTSSSFSGCSAAGQGGAISSSGGTITSVSITNCSAVSGGSAILGRTGTLTIRFSRIIRGDYSTCCEMMVYNDGGTIDARNNWWGVNQNPDYYIQGDVTVEPWLVANMTVFPPYAGPGETAEIRVNLTNNSHGEDTTGGGVFLPAGIPVTYVAESGPGTFDPNPGTITGGTNTTILTVGSTGTSIISATVDAATVTASLAGPEGIYTIGPGDSVQDAIDAAGSGDTIVLNPGTYNQHDITVTKNVTIRANTSAGGNAGNTILDGQNAGRIFDDSRGYSLAIDNLTLRNGHAPAGDNYDGYGGAVLVSWDGGNATITSSSFYNCSADYGGGAIAAFSFLPCCSHPRVTIRSSTFSNCTSPQGDALYASEYSTATMHFSRLYPASGTDMVYGAADATNNWWGTNSNPSGYTTGSVTVSPWLVMNITGAPASVTTAQISVIRVNITRNSAGTDTSSGGIFVPDGIPVRFAVNGGTGTVSPWVGRTTSGAARVRFTPAGTGSRRISATADGQTLSVSVTVSLPPPAVTGIIPAGGIRGRLVSISGISGTDFSTGATVFLNRTGWPLIAATNVTVTSPEKITCTFPVPANALLGLRSVDVKNPDGKLGSALNVFMVRAPAAPTVNALLPATGKRGTLVEITNLSGTGFTGLPKPRVRLMRNGAGINATNVTIVSDRQILCTFRIPARAAAGAWNARVTNGDNQSGTRAGAFTVRV